MPQRGGKRPGAGRKKQERPTDAACAARVLARAKAEETWLAMIDLEKRRLGLTGAKLASRKEASGAVTEGDYRGNFSIIPLTNLLRYLEDRAYGRPIDTVYHLHDKPIEMSMTLSLGEGMKLAMQKAEERVRNRK
jgi:hypothetical protein